MNRKYFKLAVGLFLILAFFVSSVVFCPYPVSAKQKDKHDSNKKEDKHKDKDKDSKQKNQSFDKWSNKTGDGVIVKGSPYHKGPEVDIDGKKGDKVGAFRSGKVEYAGPKGGFGKTVIIKDKKGNQEQYSHLDSINVKAGQKVKENKKIGTIGTTGTVIKGKGDGSHLHFQETDNKGKLISPR